MDVVVDRLFAVAIIGYSSYTAYHRSVPHSAYDLSFLINQPGTENCRTTGNESRGGGGGGVDPVVVVAVAAVGAGGSSTRALATQLHPVWICSTLHIIEQLITVHMIGISLRTN